VFKGTSHETISCFPHPLLPLLQRVNTICSTNSYSSFCFHSFTSLCCFLCPSAPCMSHAPTCNLTLRVCVFPLYSCSFFLTSLTAVTYSPFSRLGSNAVMSNEGVHPLYALLIYNYLLVCTIFYAATLSYNANKTKNRVYSTSCIVDRSNSNKVERLHAIPKTLQLFRLFCKTAIRKMGIVPLTHWINITNPVHLNTDS
jgi:hypothetical protein